MKRYFEIAMWLCSLLSILSAAVAGWNDVTPTMQYMTNWINNTPQINLTNTITITWEGDSTVEWAAEELAYQLGRIGHQDIRLLEVDTTYYQNPPTSDHIIIHIAYLDAPSSGQMHNVFDALGLWVGRGGGAIDPEGYTILVNDTIDARPIYNFHHPWLRALLTASSPRGLNYAVTSFWQAIDSTGGQQWAIETGHCIDYPTFPRRYCGDPGNTYSYSSSSQFPNANSHGRGLLRLAREVLLYNRGNGIVQYTDAAQFHNDNNSNEIARMDTVTSVLQNGYAGSPHDDCWGVFDFDWLQGIGRTEDETSRQRELASVYIQKKCRIDTTSTAGEFKLVPNGTIQVDNWRFEDQPVGNPPVPAVWGFTGTEGIGWRSIQEAGNNFGRAQLSGGQSAFIGNTFKVQDTTGIPSRLLVFECSIRSSQDSLDVLFRHLMHKDSNGFASADWNDDIARGFHRNEPVATATVSATGTWQKIRYQFYTLGSQWDSLRVELKYRGVGSVNADIDSVRIYESDIYHWYLIPDKSLATIDILRNGTLFSTVDTSDIDISVLNAGQGYVHKRVRVTFDPDVDSTYDDSTHWSAVLKYHAIANNQMPRYLDDIANPTIGYSREWQTARPDIVDTMVVQHMNWFENRFTDSFTRPEMHLTGYFNRDNEVRFRGFSLDDLLLNQAENWSCTEIEANFNSELWQALDDANPSNDVRPLLLFADMFSPIHSAKRLKELNNPFAPFDGFLKPEDEIPGADPEAHLVFVDWWEKEIRDCTQAISLFESWEEIPDTNENNWEVMFVMTPEITRLNDSTFQARRGLYQDIADAAASRRYDGRSFSGGGLFLDASATNDTTWSMFHRRIEMLQQWWKGDPYIAGIPGLTQWVTATDSVLPIEFESYPVPYPSDSEAKIDSVLLCYRYDGSSTWQKSKLIHQTDSTYDFNIALPDSGGYVKYRVWSFDDLGRYCSYPPFGTNLKDPEAGATFFLTFERRKDVPISKPDTFWLPGVISKEHIVKGGGRLVFQPLPGYKHATLYVENDAKIRVLDNYSKVIFNGTDTSYIHVKPACPTCTWKGIEDSIGVVKKSYVTFEEGTGTAIEFKYAESDTSVYLESVAYKDTVKIIGPTKISGSATFNKLIVDSGATLTILPGSEISFFEGGQLLVRDGGQLEAFGNDSTEIVFKAAVDDLPWEGIHCEVAYQAEACSLEYVTVSGAVAGLLVDRGRAHVKNSTFENNSYGIMVNNSGWLVAESCSLRANTTGLLATNLSSVELTGVVANQNTGVGVKALSRSSLYLSDCLINENDGDGLAGGIGLYTGSSAFLECTEVAANVGSGITAYGGTVMMTSVEEVGDTLGQWRGNRIEHNETIPYEGQITLRDRVALALWNGHNSIQDTSGEGTLIHWEDQVGSDRWADMYWGTLDTSDIKDELPANVTLVRIDSSASNCPTFSEDNAVHDSLVQIFLNPHNAELSAQYDIARTDYKAIVRNAQSSDYAFTACDRLFNINVLDNKPFSSLDDTLEVLFGNVSDASLKRWLRNCKGWAFAEDGDFVNCTKVLDSLAKNTPTRFDRVAAKVQLQMAEILELRADSTTEYKASECIAYLDSAQKVLEIMKVWNQTTISDSVVMYAPTTVEGLITINQPNGRLTILPHPGSEDPTVRFVSSGGIQVIGFNYSLGRGKLYVQGKADNRINLDWDSTSAYGNIYSTRGYVSLKHVNLRGTGWVNINEDILEGTGRTPILFADSCTFSGFDEGLWIYGASDSCEVTNCTFEALGGGAYEYYTGMDGSGVSIIFSDNVVIDNCQFIDNIDNGIFGYWCDNVDMSEVDVSGSGDYGLLAWDAANIDITCSNFHGNGDTLAEIWVEDGSVNLVDGYTQVSDCDGVLIYSGHPSYMAIEDGENNLELLGETGLYLKSGDTTATWDITYNAWAPLTPADSGFFGKLYPSTPSKWTVDSSLALFLECGSGGASSTGGQNLLVTGGEETSGTFSTESDGLTMKSTSLTKSTATAKSGLVAKSSKVIDHHAELAKWREFKDASKSPASRQTAITIGKQFLNEHPNSPLVPAAVVQLTSLAKRSNGKSEISSYLAQKALTTKNETHRALFTRKAYVAKAFEVNPSDAITGLEGLLETSLTIRDSICALADAIGIYAAFKSSHDLTPKHDFVKTATLPDLKHRIRELSRQLDGGTLEAAESEVPVPTSYALYQNYPNPFNPTTEIRFDLPEAVRGELRVFNILGQEVVTLVDDVRNAGAYRILWDGKNAAGLSVASGVYIYQLKTPNFTDAKKMMLLR